MTRSVNPRMLLAGAAAVLALGAAGCGAKTKSDGGSPASGTKAAAGSDVLTIPYVSDLSVADPDVFYDIEGASVILSTYQGLVTYAPNSTKIVGDLATSFTESPDRLTYTFKLKKGVRFHSGAAMTSADVKASFERRAKLGQATQYMVDPIKSMSTPDPLTFVVKLKTPTGPFLDLMASVWGPKVIGPAALRTHAGKDKGMKWLQTHEDGTGPYELTSFKRGTGYTLTRDAAYPGTKPFFRQVNIKITPDVSTQRLELQSGDLDGILHAFPASELSSLPSSLQVVQDKSLLRSLLFVNTNKAPFDDPAVRRGLRSALNIDQLVNEAYGKTATASQYAYPPELLSGQSPLPYKPDPAAAKTAMGKASTKNITLAYTADDSSVQRRVAELLQAQLTSAGLHVTLKEVQLSQAYAYGKDVKSAPDLVLASFCPDAAHPDAWASLFWSSAGGLNLLAFKNKAIDKTLADALPLSRTDADPLYRKAGDELVASDAMFFLGDLNDTFVLRKGITGVEQNPSYPWTVDYAALKRG